MHAINNVFKWSLYLSGISAFIIVGSIIAFWLMIEVLTFLVGIS